MTRYTGRAAQTIRARWARYLAEHGQVDCWRCHRPITPADTWDVGHLNDLATGGAPLTMSNTRPEHADCNRAAGARLGNQLRSRATRRLRAWT